jgi:hypothetical protein
VTGILAFIVAQALRAYRELFRYKSLARFTMLFLFLCACQVVFFFFFLFLFSLREYRELFRGKSLVRFTMLFLLLCACQVFFFFFFLFHALSPLVRVRFFSLVTNLSSRLKGVPGTPMPETAERCCSHASLNPKP